MAEKTGERKDQILQTLAQMLENPAGEKVTTAALAARIKVSEAALYRHFKGKADMFEGLIEFIEQALFGLINRITSDEKSGVRQVEGNQCTGIVAGTGNRPDIESLSRVILNTAKKHQCRLRFVFPDRLKYVGRSETMFSITGSEFYPGVFRRKIMRL